jgi:hypothetical protein
MSATKVKVKSKLPACNEEALSATKKKLRNFTKSACVFVKCVD